MFYYIEDRCLYMVEEVCHKTIYIIKDIRIYNFLVPRATPGPSDTIYIN